MSKSKTKKGAKGTKVTNAQRAAAATIDHDFPEKTEREALCVFAFRLTTEERDAIHKAAGPAKASKFARTLLVAAARSDEAGIKAILKGIQTSA